MGIDEIQINFVFRKKNVDWIMYDAILLHCDKHIWDFVLRDPNGMDKRIFLFEFKMQFNIWYFRMISKCLEYVHWVLCRKVKHFARISHFKKYLTLMEDKINPIYECNVSSQPFVILWFKSHFLEIWWGNCSLLANKCST